MREVSPNYHSLSTNGLYSSLIRLRLAEWILKNMTQLYAVYKGLTFDQRHKYLGNEKMEKDIPCK